jgi:superfamily II DNA/RNA helicase
VSANFEPIAAANEILDSLKRYLNSNFNTRRQYVKDQYLRALEESFQRREIGGSLFKEIRRPFKKGKALKELVLNGSLHPDLRLFMQNNPYEHQAQAIEFSAKPGRNLVIATGTGSGKTESFLLPILNSLLKERDTGKLGPGVRAIIIYPMNALASDQLGRFRDALAKFPEITFGRFVGPTPPTTDQAVRESNGIQFLSNERPSRDSMKEDSPHILITNYAMLEHLLLLPKWSSLFNRKLKWIVMDEVHSYDGTRGVEIGMLLRRLKERTASEDGVQCIGASATLGDGTPADNERAAKFATSLFGELFSSNDVILPSFDESVPVTPLIDVLAPEELSKIQSHIDDPRGNYHLFIKNPGGSFICLSSNHPTNLPRIRLQASKWCEDCLATGVNTRLVELGGCRKCGAEYLVYKSTDDLEVKFADDFDDSVRYSRFLDINLPDVPVTDRILDFDEIDTDQEEINQDSDSLYICPGCSTLSHTSICNRCSSVLTVSVEKELAADEAGKIRCSRCHSRGDRSPFGPIIRPVSGVDALTSVISLALYQHLPVQSSELSGGAKKLLSFSDNRQDAAYFAPYLQDSYSDFFRRRILVESLKKMEDKPDSYIAPYLLKNWAHEIKRFHNLVNQDEDELTWPWAWIRSELTSIDNQQNLTGTGILNFMIPQKNIPEMISVFQNLGFDKDQSFNLCNALLETVASEGAIEFHDGVSPSDPIFSPRESAVQFFLEGKRTLNSSFSWLPATNAGNKRSSMLQRSIGVNLEEAKGILRELWEAMIKDEILLDNKGLKSVKEEKFRVLFGKALNNEMRYCPVCHRFSWWILPNNVCVNKNCPGKTFGSNPNPENHFRYMYENLGLNSLEAREHTAQWNAKTAEVIQKEFIDGKVNVLSCSTTFEMGVDIGEVVAVLCRNVPPTPANYVQRAGRAGRQAGTKSLVVTFARKRSHDAQYAADPRRLIKGQIPVPSVSLMNYELIRRHIFALALSVFLRNSGITETKASTFFQADDTSDSNAKKFVEWLKSRPLDLLHSIKSLDIPQEAQEKLGLLDWGWVTLLTEESSAYGYGAWISNLQSLYDGDLLQVAELIKKLTSENAEKFNPRKHSLIGSLHKVETNLRERPFIELLANGGVLPKYGFPVDVATLTPGIKSIQASKDAGIELSRDLSIALSEYAPGSQVVAAGRILTSVGVRRPANIDFGSIRWAAKTCETCGWSSHERAPADYDAAQNNLPNECSYCGSQITDPVRYFIEPRFGFIAKIDPNSAGSKIRPKKRSNARTYLSSSSDATAQWKNLFGDINTSISRDAQLLTLNNSKFDFCPSCGFASPIEKVRVRQKSKAAVGHLNPNTEEDCKATRLTVTTFGHAYTTDVLRIRFKLKKIVECQCDDFGCQGAIQSAAASIVASAIKTLGIATYDLNTAVNTPFGNVEQQIMIFDTTPGGAGLAQSLDERFREICLGALAIVEGCTECKTLDTSCYACLRTYSNQSRHEHLTRIGAIEILNSIIE